jgi:hypothetical protein
LDESTQLVNGEVRMSMGTQCPSLHVAITLLEAGHDAGEPDRPASPQPRLARYSARKRGSVRLTPRNFAKSFGSQGSVHEVLTATQSAGTRQRFQSASPVPVPPVPAPPSGMTPIAPHADSQIPVPPKSMANTLFIEHRLLAASG